MTVTNEQYSYISERANEMERRAEVAEKALAEANEAIQRTQATSAYDEGHRHGSQVAVKFRDERDAAETSLREALDVLRWYEGRDIREDLYSRAGDFLSKPASTSPVREAPKECSNGCEDGWTWPNEWAGPRVPCPVCRPPAPVREAPKERTCSLSRETCRNVPDASGCSVHGYGPREPSAPDKAPTQHPKKPECAEWCPDDDCPGLPQCPDALDKAQERVTTEDFEKLAKVAESVQTMDADLDARQEARRLRTALAKAQAEIARLKEEARLLRADADKEWGASATERANLQAESAALRMELSYLFDHEQRLARDGKDPRWLPQDEARVLSALDIASPLGAAYAARVQGLVDALERISNQRLNHETIDNVASAALRTFRGES